MPSEVERTAYVQLPDNITAFDSDVVSIIAASCKGLTIFSFTTSLVRTPDFKVKIGQYEWMVHSNVLSDQSSFFERICSGPFKEAEERIVELHDDCPFTVGYMVWWFYHAPSEPRMLFDNNSDNNSGNAMLQNMSQQASKLSDTADDQTEYCAYSLGRKHALLYLIADKYQIPGLISQARESLLYLFYEDLSPGEVELNFSDFMGCLGTVVISGDQKLLNYVFRITHRFFPTSQAMYEAIAALFETDPGVMKSAQDYIFAKADFQKYEIQQLADAMRLVTRTTREIRAGASGGHNSALSRNQIAWKLLDDQLEAVKYNIRKMMHLY